ncbi:HNH endonuclease domain-containing protein [Geminocystis sp. NIES-3709]|uniref:HNH endonuclease domain-containing protein n=1 Tax=Geminocystis sp. NIES-3709 TaxID=1617448 RepID=UPI0005FCB371|nr:HNH endonuclease domain-containing protein [Geminocystis sp. NIES-3709]BAQ67042.1 HNH endonuclease:HNH nuclease [Geminocystis sp. NIES-3709]
MTNSKMNNLPESDHLNISALSQLFDATTNSYKYLFFNALLDILARKLFDNSTRIYFRELVIEILANAWYPHIFFKLSFGKQDQIANKLDQLNIEFYTEKVTKKEKLINLIGQQNLDDISNSLMRFVPFRLIRPFFANELRGTKDYLVNFRITELSTNLFDNYKPIYCFNSTEYKETNSIILNSDWVEYFKQNFTIIKGWVAWEWLNYMQKNNQNTPNLASKLFPLDKRESLHQQAKYWKIILDKQPIKCIYSHQILDKNSVSIDHYLPWSFVAHDRLWNLIPTMSSVNSSKSNNIPSSQYLAKFIQLQHQGLTISHQYLPQKEWLKYTENYLLDLKISHIEDLLNLETLTNIYNRQFEPLISLAKIQGFNDNWTY